GTERSLVQIQSPRLGHHIRSRRWLRMRLATGFELFGRIPLEFVAVRESDKLSSSPGLPMHSLSEAYVYVPDEEDGPLSRACAGAMVPQGFQERKTESSYWQPGARYSLIQRSTRSNGQTQSLFTTQ